jgi:hypothetical protein
VSGLEELRPNKDDAVVLDLLSNSSFMGTDEDGLPTPAIPGEGGTYHITGSLVTAPGPAIKKILANCNRVGKLCAACSQVTLIAPVPRYVTSRCCNNSGHLENYENDDFESEIIAGMELHKKLLEGWAMEHNLNYGIVDATELVDSVEPVLRNRVTNGGIPLWTVWDPVHLVDEAYKEMAEAILMPCSDEADFTDQGSVTSTESGTGGNKRRRPETVIVGQLEQKAKKGRPGTEKKMAGWLQGKAEWGPGRHQAYKPYVGDHYTDHPPQRGRWSWPRRNWPPRRPGASRGRGWSGW